LKEQRRIKNQASKIKAINDIKIIQRHFHNAKQQKNGIPYWNAILAFNQEILIIFYL